MNTGCFGNPRIQILGDLSWEHGKFAANASQSSSIAKSNRGFMLGHGPTFFSHIVVSPFCLVARQSSLASLFVPGTCNVVPIPKTTSGGILRSRLAILPISSPLWHPSPCNTRSDETCQRSSTVCRNRSSGIADGWANRTRRLGVKPWKCVLPEYDHSVYCPVGWRRRLIAMGGARI